MRTLLLTPWMAPHKIISWERAVVLLVLGKVDVLEEYDEEIRSRSLALRTPAVVRLKKAGATLKHAVRFSRINVYTRDGFRCQYCGEKKAMRDLNYDHVVPRVRGGKTVWENIVTSCYRCNSRKGNRTPEQAGMRMHFQPHRPRVLPMTQPLAVAIDTMPAVCAFRASASTATSTDAPSSMNGQRLRSTSRQPSRANTSSTTSTGSRLCEVVDGITRAAVTPEQYRGRPVSSGPGRSGSGRA